MHNKVCDCALKDRCVRSLNMLRAMIETMEKCKMKMGRKLFTLCPQQSRRIQCQFNSQSSFSVSLESEED